jgi:hypothetical protein
VIDVENAVDHPGQVDFPELVRRRRRRSHRMRDEANIAQHRGWAAVTVVAKSHVIESHLPADRLRHTRVLIKFDSVLIVSRMRRARNTELYKVEGKWTCL